MERVEFDNALSRAESKPTTMMTMMIARDNNMDRKRGAYFT